MRAERNSMAGRPGRPPLRPIRAPGHPLPVCRTTYAAATSPAAEDSSTFGMRNEHNSAATTSTPPTATLMTYEGSGAIILVTHDEGAVQALNPERVLLMPDGDEDLWNDSYLDLVAEE